VQHRGQIKYDYEYEADSGNPEEKEKERAAAAMIADYHANYDTLRYKKGSNGTTPFWQGRESKRVIKKKTRKYSRSEQKLDSAREVYADRLEDFLRSVGGHASSAAVGSHVKRPDVLGKKFKLVHFVNMQTKRFSYDTSSNQVTLIVTKDGAGDEEKK
jgi:hypothetical protein